MTATRVVSALCAIALGVAIWFSPGQQQTDKQAEVNQEQTGVGAVVRANQNAAPTQPTDETQPPANTEQQSSGTQSNGWITEQNAPEWLLLILTAIGATVAYWQFKQAEEAVLLTQRAYVLLDEISIRPQVNPLTPDTLIGFRVRNYGPTAATHVTFTTFELKMAGEPPHANAPLPVSAIPPNEFINPTFTVLRMMFRPEAITEASTGKKELTFALAFNYRDVFGITHQSKASGVYYGPAPAGFVIVSNEEDITNSSD